MFWQDLKIIRNNIIHAAFFQSSKEGSRISVATKAELNSKYYSQFIDFTTMKTKRIQLIINPFSVTRYN